MVEFRKMYGAVYILENPEAQRVKIGMTINDVGLRLRVVNDMWLGRRGTCQICGGRLNIVGGRVPRHPGYSRPCPGGDALPLEKEVALAETHLGKMKNRLAELSGDEKASATRRIKTLERRIGIHRHRALAVGIWQLGATVYTECAEQVELLTHEILADRLDEAVLFGEVFCCSVSEAKEAIENALAQLGLTGSATRNTRL